MGLFPGDLGAMNGTGLTGWVWGFAIAVCMAKGLFCGLWPGARTLKTNLAGVLNQGSKGVSSTGRHKTHNLLVISEIAMALVPLISAGLLLRSVQHVLEVDPGFRAAHILTMEIQQPALSFAQINGLSQEEQRKVGEKQSRQFEQIAERIRTLTGVKEVGGIDDLPLGNELRQASRFVIEGQPFLAAGARPIAQTRTVSLGYFSALGIPLRAGRTFTEDDWKVFNLVINENMARRYWPQGDAIGKRVNFCSLEPKPCWFSIVGIVGNVHQFGLDAGPTFDAYFAGGWTPYLVVHTASDPVTVTAGITEVVHKVDPNLPITHMTTMDGLLSDSVSARRFSAVLVGIFATLALLLAAIGIYGVMSY